MTMQQFKADIHIHTVLSPCADLDMSPGNIVKRAQEEGLQLIGITDHNSTENALVVKRLAKKAGIFVLTGAEVTTKEEVHCLAFFEHGQQLHEFQHYLSENIIKIDNLDGRLGDQPVVDEEENILSFTPYWLPAALKTGISAVQQKVYDLDGIFIPAHINRMANGLFAQLGFMPPDLQFDALEYTGMAAVLALRQEYRLGQQVSLVRSSDAHCMEQIGSSPSLFCMQQLSFSEVRKALHQEEGRAVLSGR